MSRQRAELSKSEWAIMDALWKQGRATAVDVQRFLEGTQGWAYSTVKTMLERMEKKGLLKVDRVGPVKRFSARKRRRDLVPKAIERFLDNVLDGSLAPLVPYIAKSRGLTAEEVDELKRILEEE